LFTGHIQRFTVELTVLDPDWVEMYAGIIAEEAKEPMVPGMILSDKLGWRSHLSKASVFAPPIRSQGQFYLTQLRLSVVTASTR
jgi:hypothetical protein